MENRNSTITGSSLLRNLVIANVILIMLGAFVKIMHWGFSHILLLSGIILFLISTVLIIRDMLKNNIYNKVFWIMSMFIMPSIAQIAYIIMREKLIKTQVKQDEFK